jgi:heme exporter protein C
LTDRDALPIPRYGVPFTLYRVVAAMWMTAVIGFGFLGDVTRLPILEHSARNLYFHVPMWFTLLLGWIVAAYHSLQYLRTGARVHDVKAEQAALVAFVFGLCGITTGIVWSRFTWYVGTDIWWNSDPRQVMVAAQLLLCAAYFVLRGALDEERRRGRLAAVYALFATVTLPFLTYVLPRRMESLHPGAEGNPAFSEMDIAPEMRWVFYSAVIGFFLLYGWIYTARVRMRRAELLAEARREVALG